MRGFLFNIFRSYDEVRYVTPCQDPRHGSESWPVFRQVSHLSTIAVHIILSRMILTVRFNLADLTGV